MSLLCSCPFGLFFFFNQTAPPEIYTLSLHDALPISGGRGRSRLRAGRAAAAHRPRRGGDRGAGGARGARDGRPGAPLRRSEEHTSELQSHSDLVCRLLLEKKKTKIKHRIRI